MNPLVPEGMIEGWKIVRPDLRTRNGYRWPWPGNWAECDNEHPFTVGDACPQFEGDGLCIAKTWNGAASGGYPAVTALLLAYWADDVLGEDDNKIRVERALVLDVFDPQQLIRYGWGQGTNLYGADLSGADLSGADLSGADLYGAQGADTSGGAPVMTVKTKNGDDVVRYEIELTELQAQNLVDASTVLASTDGPVLFYHHEEDDIFMGTTIVVVGRQIQDRMIRNRPLAVGDKVQWRGSGPGAEVSTIVAIKGDDACYTMRGGLCVGSVKWLGASQTRAVTSERVS